MQALRRGAETKVVSDSAINSYSYTEEGKDLPSELFASVTIHNEEEFDILMRYWKSLGYHSGVQYRCEIHSLQVWKSDSAITWGEDDGSAYNDGIDWISDFAGDFNEYASFVGINVTNVEIDVEAYL